MPRGWSPSSALSEAKEKEKTYSWVEAASAYGHALGMVGKSDSSRKAEIQEKIGYCLHRAAMQASSLEESKKRILLAVEAYNKAHCLHQKLAEIDDASLSRAHHSLAAAKFLDHWVADDPSEKRKLLDECLELEGKALEGFSHDGSEYEFGRTYGELSTLFDCRANTEWDRHTLKGIVQRGIEWGEKAVKTLSELGTPSETAKGCLTLATSLYFFGDYIADPKEEDDNRLKIVATLKKAVELSEESEDVFILGLTHLWLGISTGGEESKRHFEAALNYGKTEGNNLLIAGALDSLAYLTYWEAKANEDPDLRRQLAEKAIQSYKKARQHISTMPFIGTMASMRWPAGFAVQQLELALWETDPKERLDSIEKSLEAGAEALSLAESSDQPYVISYVLNIVSKTLEARALMEPSTAEKRSYLERGLEYRVRNVEILEQLIPFDYWNLGVQQNYLAGIKAELAEIDTNLETQKRLLEQALSAKERCLELCSRIVPYYESMGSLTHFAALQSYQDTYGTLLTRFYYLTNNPEHLRKSIQIHRKSKESANKLDLTSRVAEANWKIAWAQDVLGKSIEAAESFELASENYLKAAEKIPQLSDFYQDHATYMAAWVEIEKAKHHHTEKRYGKAKEHYEKAASLHKSTEAWEYLSSNYLAWARLEEAEALSRKERIEEAKDRFQQSAGMFEEAKKSIKAMLGQINAREEMHVATELVRACDVRSRYCTGRIALEEAKILDRQGDLLASSRKYAFAADAFERMAKTEPEQSSKEIRPLVYLCQAWHRMMMAEAKTSPAIYGEAAELFQKAKECTIDQPTSLLALANSSFCRALQAGAEFEATGDSAHYSMAKKHLEAAAKNYILAGFRSASNYAKATNRLFDAYMYMKRAETETDPRKKAQLYKMAEKLLEASAASYDMAKHSDKAKQINRLLESAREERQLATSLTEVLDAPAITSATTSFSTPTPMYEKAFGIERFEQASIQANLILDKNEVSVGDNITMELELVNPGKAPALLVKCERIVPEGFEIQEGPKAYRVEGSLLNMKGRQLGPLKTEEIKIIVKPISKGTFTISPEVLYMDDDGNYVTHRPEPVQVTVKELGILGWIRGKK